MSIHGCLLRGLAGWTAAILLGSTLAVAAAEPPEVAPTLALRFATEVDRRLPVPPDEQRRYAERLREALADTQDGAPLPAQHVVLVDRSANVQALLLYHLGPDGEIRFVGASPVSTGSSGRFDHFLTPLGVFAHSLDNPDFRAEGTVNENGIRGYGERGLRVFDFGWVLADRTWGAGGRSPMRLQMHATDPVYLEPRLGRADSKGCIRIAASLNRFIDRYGILDADYEAALARGVRPWVLREDRLPVSDPGRYLVVIDTAPSKRPTWAQPVRTRPTRASAVAGPANHAAC